MIRLSHFRAGIVLTCICITGPVAAKLPPPSPEQVAAAQATKDKAAAAAAAEQAALARVQDRIAAAYIERQAANGITVTPTPLPSPTSAATEVPSAALSTRPVEKAGAYNEAVTPSSAQSASSGSPAASASTPHTK